MRTTLVIASLVLGLALPDLAVAMPIASGDAVAKASSQSSVTLVRGGCGLGWHHRGGPFGPCVRNR